MSHPSIRLPLNTGTTITLDGSGNGTAKIGPSSPREIWYPNTASIFIAVQGTFCICNLYVGPQATAQWIVDTSYLGGGDSTGRVAGYPVSVGYFVWAVWSKGPANQSATLSLLGEKTAPR